MSSEVKRVRDTVSSAKRYICAWGIITPFESPVVPDVKKIEPKSECFTSGRLTVSDATNWSQLWASLSIVSRSFFPCSIASSEPTKTKSSMELNASATSKIRGMYSGEITAIFGVVVETWCDRNAPLYPVLMGTSTRPAIELPNHEKM